MNSLGIHEKSHYLIINRPGLGILFGHEGKLLLKKVKLFLKNSILLEKIIIFGLTRQSSGKIMFNKSERRLPGTKKSTSWSKMFLSFFKLDNIIVG